MGKKIFLILLGILVPLSIVFALEIAWPPSPMGTRLTDASTLTELSRYLYEWGIALGGLAAFIALLIAGFLYLTSVGDPQKLADARGRIIWALAGLVLLLAAWLILNTINPDLTSPNLEELLPGCDASSTIDTAVTPCPVVTDPPSCCEPNYICIGDKNPWDGDPKGICVSKVIADELYGGTKLPPCVYARLWTEKEFAAPPVATVEVGKRQYTHVGPLPVPGPSYRSVKSFYDDGGECATNTTQVDCEAVIDPDGNRVCGGGGGNRLCDWNPDITTSFGPGYHCFRDCGEHACGCFLKLYDYAVPGFIPPLVVIPIVVCADKLADYAQACSKDLIVYKEAGSKVGDGEPHCIYLSAPSF